VLCFLIEVFVVEEMFAVAPILDDLVWEGGVNAIVCRYEFCDGF